MTDRELMQQSLDALTFDGFTPEDAHHRRLVVEAIEALRARLAQGEPEPVAWTVRGLITDFSRDFSAYQTKTYTVPLYTTPPQSKWQGLTDDEIRSAWRNVISFYVGDEVIALARAVEYELREKNNG
jgi:hypothetical protein